MSLVDGTLCILLYIDAGKYNALAPLGKGNESSTFGTSSDSTLAFLPYLSLYPLNVISHDYEFYYLYILHLLLLLLQFHSIHVQEK